MATGWPMKTTYADGDVYSASDVNDTNGTLNLATGAQWAAGKNRLINGNLAFNQRAFTSNTTTGSYNFDRFVQFSSGGTMTVTPQLFTAGTAPVAGYEAKNYVRIITASQSAAGDYAAYGQKIEDVRTLAGQTATVSFWAKASTGTPKIGVVLDQYFGTGGSASTTVTNTTATQTITTSWVRYSFTITVPSISGKTIGTNNDSSLNFYIFTSTGSTYVGLGYPNTGIQNITVDAWGFQVEQGSTMTAFALATGTIATEFVACQRYYQTVSSILYKGSSSGGFAPNAYDSQIWVNEMRVAPTITFFAHDGTAGAVTLYVAGVAIKSTTVAAMYAYTFGYSGNYGATAWGSNADSGLLAYKYNASAEL
jgi:hypothetical protein